ncbi:amino acid ABC transporter ATP-binding/permease protein [Corynebacterium uterequi]|uniref:ABC-type transport system, fused ATPase and permease n=1 Tax=Corynebacterium uterequi TaxID=1072256 RepID=A0A0G3HLJ4_9CORY|nr:ABC transporter ATP-binding protein [Corynebacterium uterequi]AKK12007.1 ABC-type transport system, fused ATPase and permease [Corynebacterium uterequi]
MTILRWLLGVTRPVHPPLLASALLRCLNLGLGVVMFGLAGYAVASAFDGSLRLAAFGWLIAAAIAKAVAYYLEQFLGHLVAFKALELLRSHAFSRLWPTAPGTLMRARSGDLLATLTRDVDRIEVVYAHTFAPLVAAVVVPATAVLSVGAAVGWSVVAVPAACLLLSLLVVPSVGVRSTMRATRRALDTRRELSAHVTDSVFGADEITGYAREADRLDEQSHLDAAVARQARVGAVTRAVRRGANVALLLISVLAVAWHSAELGLPTAFALTVGTLYLFEGPRGVEDAVGTLDYSVSAARRLYELCHEPPLVTDGPRTLTLDAAPRIDFADVTYTYPGASEPVLTNFTLSVAPGEHVTLMGPSGCGKTTAAQLLARFDDPDAGHILINGVDATEYTLDSLRAAVAVVGQRPQLLHTTVAANLRLGNPEASDEELYDALRAVELGEEITDLNRNVGQDGARLSGGQAQRLCLARALVARPKVLILDEFTASLNVELAQRLRANLAARGDALTIVEIAHTVEPQHPGRIVRL